MFTKSNVSFWVFKVLDNCPSNIRFHGFYFGCNRWCCLLCVIFRLGRGTVDCCILITGDRIWSRGTSQDILGNSFWPCSKKCRNVYCSACTKTPRSAGSCMCASHVQEWRRTVNRIWQTSDWGFKLGIIQ